MSALASPPELPSLLHNAALRTAPLDAALGARIEGFDVQCPPTAGQVAALKAALRAYHILVRQQQQPRDAENLCFASYFGSIVTPPHDAPVLGSNAAGVAPDIVHVSNTDEDGVLGNPELTAHCDHHRTPQPS